MRVLNLKSKLLIDLGRNTGWEALNLIPSAVGRFLSKKETDSLAP